METRNFLRNVLYSLSKKNIQNDEADLFEEGILDSLNLVRLINELEKKYHFVIKIEDVTPENFSTVRTITRLVQKYVGVTQNFG